MTSSDTMPGVELESVIRRAMAGEQLDVTDAFLRTELIVPSGGPIGENFVGFVPVLFDRGETPMLAVFTSFELLSRGTALAKYAVTMTGRDLVLRMPGDNGIVLNPRHDVGFELFPEAVQAVARRARASDVEVLSEAVVAYLGFERERSPRTDAAAADAVAIRNGSPSRTSAVEQLVAESLAVPVDWSSTSLGDAGRAVAAEMKRRHPGISDLAADAMGWNFTFQWR